MYLQAVWVFIVSLPVRQYIYSFPDTTLACDIMLCNVITNARVSNNYTLNDLNDVNPRFLTIIIQNFKFI